MRHNSKRSKRKKLITLAAILFLLILLVLGGIFGVKRYLNYKENMIYSVGDSMKFSDFTVKLTKAEIKPVDLPFEDNIVSKYGNMDKKENC